MCKVHGTVPYIARYIFFYHFFLADEETQW